MSGILVEKKKEDEQYTPQWSVSELTGPSYPPELYTPLGSYKQRQLTWWERFLAWLRKLWVSITSTLFKS